MVPIAATSLSRTEELLRQTRVARRVANVSEFDLPRATVRRDNQKPGVMSRRGDRDVAYLRLRKLLNLPLDEPLQLTTPIDEPGRVTSIVAANASETPLGRPASDTSTANRAPVRESEEALRASEGLLKVARADFFPSLSLTSNYQRLFFPQNVFPTLNQYSENWTVGGTIAWSLFSGVRTGGQVEGAQANLDEARARPREGRARPAPA